MYSLPKGLVFRAIEGERPPLADGESELERSRFVCYRCSRQVHALVICDGPVCPRCTGVAQIQRVLSGSEDIPEPISREAKQATEILARHHGMRHFQLDKSPKLAPTSKTE
jgi:hypothetical protein